MWSETLTYYGITDEDMVRKTLRYPPISSLTGKTEGRKRNEGRREEKTKKRRKDQERVTGRKEKDEEKQIRKNQ